MINYESFLIKKLGKFSNMADGILYKDDESKVVVVKEGNGLELRFIRPDGSLTSIQSKILINNPLDLFSDYAKGMALVTGMIKNPYNIVILGGGGSILMNFFRNFFPKAKISGVEINQQVINIAKSYFGFEATDNFQIVKLDGIKYLENNKEEIDILILDIFTNKGQPLQFTTLEFYELCYSRLSKNGVFCLNVHQSTLLKITQNLRSLFGKILKSSTKDSTTYYCFKNNQIKLDEIKENLLNLNNNGLYSFPVPERIKHLTEVN